MTDTVNASLTDIFNEIDFDESPETEEVESVTDEVTEETEKATSDEPKETTPERLKPPEFFSKEQKEYFEKLQDIEGGAEYAKIWNEQYKQGQDFINAKLQEVAAIRRDFDVYNNNLSPIVQRWRQQGIDPANGLSQLSRYMQMLESDPQSLINEIAQTKNVDLEQFLIDRPYNDPELFKLQQQNQALQQQIENFNRTQQLIQNQTVTNQVTEFVNAKDDNGNLKYPYVARLEMDMANLLRMPNNGIDDLEKAYNYAVQYNSEIQAEIRSEKEKQEANQRHKQALKASEASTKTTSKHSDAGSPRLTWEQQLDKDAESWDFGTL